MSEQRIEVNRYSIHTVKVFASTVTGERLHGNATGFFIEYDGVLFFVTNKHVVTGKNIFTGENQWNNYPFPPHKLHLKAILSPERPSPYKAPTNTQGYEFPLNVCSAKSYEEIQEHRPCWYKNETLNQDVAVFCFGDANRSFLEVDGKPYWINRFFHEVDTPKFHAKVMDNCFIIGYPNLGKQFSELASPIYKGATLASEPGLMFEPQCLLVDGKTKPGMSGSPVIYKSRGCRNWHLMGVYSGRESSDPELVKSELGMVWPFEQCIEPILKAHSSVCKSKNTRQVEGAPKE